ncbi:uncharacterized protein [Parasteatoda tepidariorum]|uniref:uncharacterized protein n=1 Tax=Parasteatoda tepidariorum TaxID=114398 RepID=UPI001C7249B2|nr:uncharacterized protein LOC107447922 [Parasteatoda tepidariorum]
MFNLRRKKQKEEELKKSEATAPTPEPSTQTTDVLETTTVTEPDPNSELCKEASASDTEPQIQSTNEPPAKKRKKKKKQVNDENKEKTASCPSTSESLHQPDTPTSTPMDATEENPTKEMEPTNTDVKEQSKCLKVLIRGLPKDFNPAEISLELGKLNLEIYKIVQFQKMVGGAYRPLPLFLVILPKLANHEKVYYTEKIKQFPVSVELFHGGRRPQQCFRCQGFGHSQRMCTEKPRCMKCAEGHFSYQYTKSRDTPPTCCNCRKDHTSNFSGCEARPSRKKTHTKAHTHAASAHRLVSLMKELQELMKDQEVLSLLQTLLKGISPSQ